MQTHTFEEHEGSCWVFHLSSHRPRSQHLARGDLHWAGAVWMNYCIFPRKSSILKLKFSRILNCSILKAVKISAHVVPNFNYWIAYSSKDPSTIATFPFLSHCLYLTSLIFYVLYKVKIIYLIFRFWWDLSSIHDRDQSCWCHMSKC